MSRGPYTKQSRIPESWILGEVRADAGEVGPPPPVSKIPVCEFSPSVLSMLSIARFPSGCIKTLRHSPGAPRGWLLCQTAGKESPAGASRYPIVSGIGLLFQGTDGRSTESERTVIQESRLRKHHQCGHAVFWQTEQSLGSSREQRDNPYLLRHLEETPGQLS